MVYHDKWSCVATFFCQIHRPFSLGKTKYGNFYNSIPTMINNVPFTLNMVSLWKEALDSSIEMGYLVRITFTYC